MPPVREPLPPAGNKFLDALQQAEDAKGLIGLPSSPQHQKRMSRRESSVFDTLVTAPWPFGVTLGVVVLVLGQGVLPRLIASSQNPYLSSFAKQIATGVFSPLVWVVAIACWSAAAISAWRQSRRRNLLDTRSDLDSLRAMNWRELEQLVSEAYRRLGFEVEETGMPGADGGVDLRLRRNGQLTLVQCKHWRTQRVGAPIMREQFGLLAHHQAAAVIIVSTGDFTSEARAFAQGKPIELIAGPELLALVRGVKRTTTPVPGNEPTTPTQPAATVVTCPKCDSPMVRRTARQTGAVFLGCSRYPACRGTRMI